MEGQMLDALLSENPLQTSMIKTSAQTKLPVSSNMNYS